MDVAIIDYGSGNLRSAAKAFAWAADQAGDTRSIKVTSNPDDLKSAGHIVLPGVGAFADCMTGLNGIEGMREALEEQVIRGGKPFLGICVGMQLMADSGHEHEITKGFGWIPGKVEALAPAPKSDGRPRKIPHMGWNQLQFAGSGHPILAGLENDGFVYFVHGYHMVSKSPADILATAEYGQSVTAAIGRENIVGTQFHPEKSQVPGLRLISNFLTWRP